MKFKSLYVLFYLASLLVFGCSAERNNPLSKTYHNTTARYNGYFLAREKMLALEKSLQDQMQYDYNQVLPIYPMLDSTVSKAFSTDLEDIIKKASYPIQYHKNSKWVDNSYILVGKANYYQMKFADAAKTFKYVNSTSNDSNDKHEALVWLMRTFMKMGEMDNALQVSEHLRKERLNRENAKELYLARAHYYTIVQDTAAVIKNLALSVPNFKEKDEQSRIRFTLAQLYQLSDQDKEAYKLYSKILRHNPPYDLGFFSRLNLGQVSELNDKKDKERIADHYEKLLKDDKNTEYRNKIYFEMAQFELRKQNYEEALKLLNKSLKTAGAIQNQKAYSYVLAGKIYFDNLYKYNLAAAYYDSASQIYPVRAPEYESVIERRDILANFAKQFNTIQTQDSLQRLARMSESERNVYLQQLAQQREEKRLQELNRQQLNKEDSQQNTSSDRSRQNNLTTIGSGTGGNIWYFDNPVALASAKAEFTRRWGDRPLQDFWRIRSRGETGNEAQISRAPIDAPENQMSPEQRTQVLIQEYLKEIPLTKAALARSEKEIEDAYFKLANIYSQNLKDSDKAIQTFEELLKRFPYTEHAADAYYSLYLLYGKVNNQTQQQVYYNKIKQQFPNTTYARLVDDSDFMSKNAADNLKAHELYASAYAHYEEQQYKEATKVINTLISQYPLNDIQDKIAFLDAMVAARTQKPEVLRQKLNSFITAYPGSPLTQQANQLLNTYKELEAKNQLRKDAAPVEKAPTPKNVVSVPVQEKKPLEQIVSNKLASTEKKEVVNSEKKETAKSNALKEEPKVSQVKKPDAPTATAKEEIKQPVNTETPKVTVPADPIVDLPVTASPPADPLAYKVAEDTAYYYVMVFPKTEAAFKDIQARYEKYNSTYYKNQALITNIIEFSQDKNMLVVKGFKDPALAQSYNVKQKAPQSPIGRIRGVDFINFAISSANYQKFLQKRDLEAYLTFIKNNN